MGREVTLFTGQWADLPLLELAAKAKEFGFDGLELACWGDHLDVDRAATDSAYCDGKRTLLAEHGLGCWAISHHLAGQLVCDLNDERSDAFAPEKYKGDPEGKRRWAVETMKNAARAARNLGVDVVCGFTGSSIWHLLYSFPPVSPEAIDVGYRRFAELWNPILDVFDECGVRFALEVHPTEIAFDVVSAGRALTAIGRRESFGFNFDPSHLQWQGIEPARFITEFGDRIYHVHMKDAAVTLDGRTGILSSHLIVVGTFGRSAAGMSISKRSSVRSTKLGTVVRFLLSGKIPEWTASMGPVNRVNSSRRSISSLQMLRLMRLSKSDGFRFRSL